MPRSKKSNGGNIGVGMSAKQMRRKKPINTDLMVDINPLTDNQKKFFDEYKSGKNMFMLTVPQVLVRLSLPCITH